MRIRTVAVLLSALALCACSTTKVLQPGQYRYASTDIDIVGDSDLSASDISQYVRQKPNKYFIFGWNPFLNIYNWGGNSQSDFSILAKKIGTPPVVFDPFMVDRSIENIKTHLEYIGYYNSTVTASTDTVRQLARVKYTVVPGKRYLIEDIDFDLPSNPEFAEEFLADSAARGVKVGDYLSESSLEAESSRSATYMRNLGYYDFNKNHYFFIADTLTNPGHTTLNYSIREYTRNENESSATPVLKYHIGNVNISHAASVPFKGKVLTGLNTIKPGDVYNETSVNTTYNRLSALRVFSGVNIEMTPTDSATVDCNITLSESRQQGFKANIEASSNSSGLLGLSPQLSFYHKNFFHGGEWLTLGFTGNFQYKLNYDIRSTEYGVSADLSLPKFLGLPYTAFSGPNIPRTVFKAAYNYQDRPEYTRNIVAFSYGYSGKSSDSKLLYQFYPLELSFVRLSNLDAQFERTLNRNPYMRYAYQNHFDAGIGGVFYYTTNSAVVPKTPYQYARLNVDLSGNAISVFKPLMKTNDLGQGLILGSPYTQYVRTELNVGKTFRWGENNGNALATRIQMGYGFAYGNSTAMPFEKQFYAGGANSMRGWQVRSLGPGFSPLNETFSIPSQTGDVKLEADVEYRNHLFWKIEGALFAEVGNVWSRRSDDLLAKFDPKSFYKSLGGDWGIGVRVDLDFILVRIDAGFKVHDPSREEGHRWLMPQEWVGRDGYAIHFGVGYPF